MMLMVALTSRLECAEALGGLCSSMLVSTLESVGSEGRVTYAVSMTKQEAGELTRKFGELSSSLRTRTVAQEYNEDQFCSIDYGEVPAESTDTAKRALTKSMGLGAYDKIVNSTSALKVQWVDNLDSGEGNSVDCSIMEACSEQAGLDKVTKKAILVRLQSLLITDADNNMSHFQFAMGANPQEEGGCPTEFEYGGENGECVDAQMFRILWVHQWDHACLRSYCCYSYKAAKKGAVLLGLVAGLVVALTCGLMMFSVTLRIGAGLIGLGSIAMKSASDAVEAAIPDEVMRVHMVGAAILGAGGALTFCPDAPWHGQNTFRTVHDFKVADDAHPARSQRDGCRHDWYRLGFCDDCSCGDGEVWRCAKCGLWFCDGPCERMGSGRPPLLNFIVEARRAMVTQLLRLLRLNDVPWTVVVFLANLAVGEAVVCRTCFDQIVGCTGGAACPLIATSTANGLVLAGAVVAGGATMLVGRDIFPLRFTRVLHRGILDSLLVVGRRPPPGTPVDVASLTTAQLSDPVATAGVELDSLLMEVGTRISAATTQMEISRLNAITTNLTARQKLSAGAKGAIDMGNGTSALVGVYTYCVVLAMRIVRTKTTDVTVVTDGERAGTADSEGSMAPAVPPAKMIRPTSEHELFSMLTVWTMLLSGLGVAQVLVTGVFLMDVVYDRIHEGSVTWQTAFELFLVYLEEVERTAGDDINLSNVYQRGAQDTFLLRARERTPKSGRTRSIFRREPGDDDDEGAVQWNGSWNRKAKACCISFNIGAKKHPAASLNERGGCKFNHVCDHWVDDKGPSGTCGGDHPRIKCTNPHKCDKKLE